MLRFVIGQNAPCTVVIACAKVVASDPRDAGSAYPPRRAPCDGWYAVVATRITAGCSESPAEPRPDSAREIAMSNGPLMDGGIDPTDHSFLSIWWSTRAARPILRRRSTTPLRAPPARRTRSRSDAARCTSRRVRREWCPAHKHRPERTPCGHRARAARHVTDSCNRPDDLPLRPKRLSHSAGYRRR